MTSLAAQFERSYGFRFDEFQRKACVALEDDASVLVAAPTGAGKTVVGEFAAWLALKRGGKTFYTTPIKALSNQKYGDFVALHGAANVGLLTGDNSLNGDAPIVVMTTEVLRNMIYEDSPTLSGLHYVVLDEVHYLQDRYRGAVWEEVLIHLPLEVQTVSLSATVSNSEEFADWLQTLRGHIEVVIEAERPVEIRHLYMAGDELLPMFVKKPNGDFAPNPRARELDSKPKRSARPGRGGKRRSGKNARIPLRTEVIDRLAAESMLPAIYFIFSRKGCDQAVKQCLRDNLRLTLPDERRTIRDVVEARVTDLSDAELDVLGYEEFLRGLLNGVAAHHAGMIPPFKEIVEDLFSQGLVRAVFATETLALGINMPARTVAIESLTKFTGEKHELMTPGQYTQLSGRAGRRGIDVVGNSLVLMQRFTPFDTITRLASTRTYPLQSSFQPSYNMAVNLVRNYDQADAEHLVNSSFAQFQGDRDIVHLEKTRERQEAYLASYRERMACELGDVEEYLELMRAVDRADPPRRSSNQASIGEAIKALRPGDVVELTSGKRAGRYAVLEVSQRRSERKPRVLALSGERSITRLNTYDFDEPPRRVAHLELPKSFHVREARGRRHLARRLNALQLKTKPRRERAADIAEDPESQQARAALEAHPCHKCPDLSRHLHFAERARNLERETARLTKRIGRRTTTLVRRFEKVLAVLRERGYVEDWNLTPFGETLTGVYNEADLLVVEALRSDLLQGLDLAELAAVASTLVYETRGPEPPVFHGMPTEASHKAWMQVLDLWRAIRANEDEHGVELTREPDPGFAERAYDWASGAALSDVLDEDDAPGDFVRATKQLIDLLRQLIDVSDDETQALHIRGTVDALQRGVVAYSSLEV
jgi:ATP-dependent RNA helicase HelY